MKIPEQIRIGGIEYDVKYTPNLNDGINIAYGHIDFEKCLIELSETIDMNTQKQGVVLWHEILHGIINNMGATVQDEENVVDMFARGIYQVLQDNGRRLFDIAVSEVKE